MGSKKLIFILIIFLWIIGCYNPFFPKVIAPPHEEGLLSTPEGVIKQLQLSYRTRNIDLFKELIYSDSLFRFYVQHNIYKDKNLNKINKIDTEGLEMENVPKTQYWYLTSTQEINIHKNLFQSDEINFVKGLVIKNSRLILDSSYNKNEPDSIYILHIEKPEISITSSIIKKAFGTRSYTFKVGEQIFFVKKKYTASELGDWKILYWFELDPK